MVDVNKFLPESESKTEEDIRQAMTQFASSLAGELHENLAQGVAQQLQEIGQRIDAMERALYMQKEAPAFPDAYTRLQTALNVLTTVGSSINAYKVLSKETLEAVDAVLLEVLGGQSQAPKNGSATVSPAAGSDAPAVRPDVAGAPSVPEPSQKVASADEGAAVGQSDDGGPSTSPGDTAA